jgi:MoxR-like ATPase
MRTPDISARETFYAAVRKDGLSGTITRQGLNEFVKKHKLPYPHWFFNDAANRVSRGVFRLDDSVPTAAPIVAHEAPQMLRVVAKNDDTLSQRHAFHESSALSLVPEPFQGYVPFGHYDTVTDIVKSGLFYPVFITGLSGNGKTLMPEQVHAMLQKEIIRVPITIETDEDDLLGGFRLINGETVWENGPVIIAMERGCTVILDEVDLGSNKLMCLQPILEGKPVYLKKINKVVKPAPGFNIFATANTKGKGSDDGRFIGTNVLNEAFLERFSITLEQHYPEAAVETKILNEAMAKNGQVEPAFVKCLVAWADCTRRLFLDGGIGDLISTRRLVHIVQAYSIFKDRAKSIDLCISRFDETTKNSFLQLYAQIDESINPTPKAPAPEDKKEGN